MSRFAVLGAVLVAGVALGATPALAAGPYPPPSQGTGTVEPSHIKIGECATFSGDGFAPLTSIAVGDNGADAGTTTTDVNGQFSKQLCYPSGSKKGRHDLTGTGSGSQGDTLTVTAVLIVEGASQSASNPSTAQGGSAGPAAGTSGSGPSSSVTAPTAVVGGTSSAVREPPAVPQQGSVTPVSDSTSGLRLIALGATGLGFALLASLLLILISRRSRRSADGEGWPLDLAPAV